MALSKILENSIAAGAVAASKLKDFTAAVDLNGVELLLDADQDTSITADTDDRIDFKIANVEHFSFSNSSGDTVVKPMVDAKDIIFQQYDGNKLFEINDGNFVSVGGNSAAGGEIRIYEDTDLGTNYSGFKVGNLTSSVAYQLPLTDAASSGQALTSNSSGVLSWSTISTAYDDLTAGDAAINLTTTAGNITIDAQGNDTDIIFKGTDGGADRVFMTIDGSAGGDLFLTGGLIDLKNDGSAVSNIKFYCESSNAHAQTLIGAPHSESADNVLTLPGTGGDARLVSTASTATLTNKTLTSPKINEDVAVTTTATEINLIDGGATVGTTAIADGDGLLINDAGTMRVSTVQTLAAYLDDEITAMPNLTSVGTLTALTIDDVAIDGKVMTMTGSSGDTFVTTVAANGATSLVTTDASAAAAHLTITADGTVDINSAGVLTLDSGAAINIEPASGSAILLDGTISIDAGVVTGATSITSTAFVGGLTGNVTGNASGTALTVTQAAQSAITSVGTLTALTVDDVAVDGKVITMTGSSGDTFVTTVAANGATSLVTTDASAAAANFSITADGTVDIDSAGVLTLDSGAAINIEPASGSAILLDGTISIDAGVVTGATSVTSTAFVGNLTGTVATATQNSITTATGLVSVGALDSGSITSGFTSIDVGAGAITTTGALSSGALTATGAVNLNGGAFIFNEAGADLDFRVESNSYTHALFVDGGNDRVTIGNDTNGGGTLTVSDGDSGATAVASGNEFVIEDDGASGMTILSSTSTAGSINFGDSGDSDVGRILYNHADDSMSFTTAGAALHTRMDAYGRFMLGTTSATNVDPNGLTVRADGNGNYIAKFAHRQAGGDGGGIYIDIENYTGSPGQNMMAFLTDAGQVGGIKSNQNSTAYNTSSDYRLKENVDYTWDATTRLKQLKPARFNFINDDTNTLVDGFLAHEVSSIVPEAITGTKDETKDLTNVVLKSNGVVKASNVTEAEWTQGKTDGEYPSDSTWAATHTENINQSIDQAKLVPLLVKTIQELEARITALEDANNLILE